MASPSSSSSSSAIILPEEIKYDVFISFRGEDTRTTVTSHLYKALFVKNIVTYKDDVKLEIGGDISPSLLKAIQRSKISVVIFSKRYASSWWCLDELVHIIDCRKRNGQFVIPIFYHVDPYHVRHQKDSYATDFAKLEQRFEDKRLKAWRSALTEAAKLSGFHYPNNSRYFLIFCLGL